VLAAAARDARRVIRDHPGMRSALIVLALMTGCTTATYMGGEWRPESHGMPETAAKRERIAEADRLTFLWGFIDDGPKDLHSKIAEKLKPGESVTDMTVKDSRTILGLVIGFFSVGIISQSEMQVDGRIELAPHEVGR
jgi:hypothetical protein